MAHASSYLPTSYAEIRSTLHRPARSLRWMLARWMAHKKKKAGRGATRRGEGANERVATWMYYVQGWGGPMAKR